MNRLGIYGALRVPEIWRFDGRNLRILFLQEDGTYREIAQSKALPWISIDAIRRFAAEELGDDTQWAKSFRRWVQDVIVPRARGNRGGE